MRLIERDKRVVYIKAPAPVKDARGVVKPAFAAVGTEIRAIVRPLTSQLARELYGLRANKMLQMLYDGTVILKEGDGVCVYVDAAASPDYRIVSVKVWSTHTSCELEVI